MALSRTEAAERLDVHERTVDRYIRKGLLTAAKGRPGTQGTVEITEESVDALLANRFVPIAPSVEPEGTPPEPAAMDMPEPELRGDERVVAEDLPQVQGHPIGKSA